MEFVKVFLFSNPGVMSNKSPPMDSKTFLFYSYNFFINSDGISSNKSSPLSDTSLKANKTWVMSGEISSSLEKLQN